MAGNGKRGGGDRVLESRHLVSLFLGVVLLCGVFFTLGYVMGHNQYGGPVHAEADRSDGVTLPVHAAAKPKAAEAPQAAAPAPAPAGSEWDFYQKKTDNHLEPVAKPAATSAVQAPAVATRAANPAPAAPDAGAKTVPASAHVEPPKQAKGSVFLQVAALTHQSDALAMADVLQQKHFPSFVVAPSTDNFYRVQVGPFADEKSADAAKAALDHAGFKAIIKR